MPLKPVFAATLAIAAAAASPVSAAVFDITIDGSDAIFLAGRTDLTIPDASLPWGDTDRATDDGMLRHTLPTPEEIKETLPPEIAVSAGQTVRVLDPAVGGISFFNGFGAPFFGPDGNPGDSVLYEFGGLSGYLGPEGALTGVFLDASIPTAPFPPTLDFTASGLGTDFTSLSPDLGQIFYIGNGQTSGGAFQEFIAPVGTTRLVLGIPDGFGFDGLPGAYDDNDGAYRIRVGIDEIPAPVPLPASLLLLGVGLVGLGTIRRNKAG